MKRIRLFLALCFLVVFAQAAETNTISFTNQAGVVVLNAPIRDIDEVRILYKDDNGVEIVDFDELPAEVVAQYKPGKTTLARTNEFGSETNTVSHTTSIQQFVFTIKQSTNDICLVEYLAVVGRMGQLKVHIKNAPKTYFTDKIDFTRQLQSMDNEKMRLTRWAHRLNNWLSTIPIVEMSPYYTLYAVEPIKKYNADKNKYEVALSLYNEARNNLAIAMDKAKQAKPYHHPIKCFGYPTTEIANTLSTWKITKILK
jgi:hypothetical protein